MYMLDGGGTMVCSAMLLSRWLLLAAKTAKINSRMWDFTIGHGASLALKVVGGGQPAVSFEKGGR